MNFYAIFTVLSTRHIFVILLELITLMWAENMNTLGSMHMATTTPSMSDDHEKRLIDTNAFPLIYSSNTMTETNESIPSNEQSNASVAMAVPQVKTLGRTTPALGIAHRVTVLHNTHEIDTQSHKLSKIPNAIKMPASTEDKQNVRFVRYDAGDTIRLRCRIPNGPYLVLWNKVGLDYPLTTGLRRFVPDDRVSVRFRQPDKWRLTITNARPTDSGVYTCSTSADSQTQRSTLTNKVDDPERPSKSTVPEYINDTDPEDSLQDETVSSKSAYQNTDYYVTVVEPHLADRLQVDAPSSDRHTVRDKIITVTGPKLVFYGTSLELTCRVTFPSPEAKMIPNITLEWYHRGVRRRPSPTRTGGVQITERWLDSHLLESRLFIAWVSEADAGQWICLERSGSNQRSHLSQHDLRVPNRIHPSSMARTSWHPTQVQPTRTGNTLSDLAFDRIEVEIVDLPDPTISTFMTTANTMQMPAFAVRNDPAAETHSSSFRNDRTLRRAGKRGTSDEMSRSFRLAAVSMQSLDNPSNRLQVSVLTLSLCVALVAGIIHTKQ